MRATTYNQHILCLPTYRISLERDPTQVWTTLQRETLKNVDLTSIHTILIPVNVGIHWILAHINITQYKIAIYNSLYNEPTQEEYTGKLQTLLAAAPGLEDKTWKTRPTADFPEQTHKNDSGLFTCVAALCISSKTSMKFDHNT